MKPFLNFSSGTTETVSMSQSAVMHTAVNIMRDWEQFPLDTGGAADEDQNRLQDTKVETGDTESTGSLKET